MKKTVIVIIILIAVIAAAVAIPIVVRTFRPLPVDGPGELDPSYSGPYVTALTNDDNDWQSKLNGAWEKKGVLGTRIEIDGDKLLILWMNNPVLETTFSLTVDGGTAALVLADKGLRYEGDGKDYATVTSLIYREGKLEFTESFPVSGEKKETLSKTENSRYGNYDIADEVLDELQGTWQDESGYYTIVFSGDEMTLNEVKTNVHVLKNKADDSDKPTYLIADANPAVTEFGGITRPEYRNGVLTAYVIVYDADSIKLTFTKK